MVSFYWNGGFDVFLLHPVADFWGLFILQNHVFIWVDCPRWGWDHFWLSNMWGMWMDAPTWGSNINWEDVVAQDFIWFDGPKGNIRPKTKNDRLQTGGEWAWSFSTFQFLDKTGMMILRHFHIHWDGVQSPKKWDGIRMIMLIPVGCVVSLPCPSETLVFPGRMAESLGFTSAVKTRLTRFCQS